jgi:hypothetical protein
MAPPVREHLRHKQVRVVPRVAHDRDPLGVARHVRAVQAEQELRGILALIEEGMADGTVAVQALEIQLRRARVPEVLRLDVTAERGTVGRDIVGDELPEDRPAGRDLTQRLGRVGDVATVARPTRAANGVERRFLRLQRGPVGEHAAVS